MLTGYGESEVQCLEAGADDFIEKPFTSSELLGTIEAQIKKLAANNSFDNVLLVNSLEDQS